MNTTRFDTCRAKPIAQFAIDLTLAQLNASHIQTLGDQELDDAQVLDLIHAISIFA